MWLYRAGLWFDGTPFICARRRGAKSMLDETNPKLSKDKYEDRVEAIAKRVLAHFAAGESGVINYEEGDIRPYIGETESLHGRLPRTVITHAHHEPGPGAWAWINNVAPLDGLRRQALDVLSQDVARVVEEFAQSPEHTYRHEGETYLSDSFDVEADSAVREGDQTHVVITSAVADAPGDDSQEASEMKAAIADAVEGSLYEEGYVGHETDVHMEEVSQ